jgi:hypothetical protein
MDGDAIEIGGIKPAAAASAKTQLVQLMYSTCD